MAFRETPLLERLIVLRSEYLPARKDNLFRRTDRSFPQWVSLAFVKGGDIRPDQLASVHKGIKADMHAHQPGVLDMRLEAKEIGRAWDTVDRLRVRQGQCRDVRIECGLSCAGLADAAD